MKLTQNELPQIIVVVLLIILGLVSIDEWQTRKRNIASCVEIGGNYMDNYRSSDTCIKDGLIIEIY